MVWWWLPSFLRPRPPASGDQQQQADASVGSRDRSRSPRRRHGSEERLIPRAEVATHSVAGDCWIIVAGKVYDVTQFASVHPGGPSLMYDLGGAEYLDAPLGKLADPAESPLAALGAAALPERPVESESFAALRKALRTEVLTVTGGFGAMVQRYMKEVAPLLEADYRQCAELQKHPQDLHGNHDVLSLTRPDVVDWVTRRSMEGCNIVGTATFNTQRISQDEYNIPHDLIYTMAKRSAELGTAAKEKLLASGLRHRFVGGQLGPTTRTAACAIDVEDASARNVSFDELEVAYGELAEGLIDGGTDVIMIDCGFDTLNMKAAIYAIEVAFAKRQRRIPVMVSMSLVDDSGRTLSGQSIEAFYASVRHCRPFTVGFNCGKGPEQMPPYLTRLSSVAECFVHAYPNAGLPDTDGGYSLEPEPMAEGVSDFVVDKVANVVGGCCGAGPAHLAAISSTASKKAAAMTASLRIPSSTNNGGHFDPTLYPPGSEVPWRRPHFLLCGTEALAWNPDGSDCRLVTCVEVAPGDAHADAIQRIRDAASEEDVACIGLKLRADMCSAAAQRLAHGIQGEPDLCRKPLLLQVVPMGPSAMTLATKVLRCLQGRCLVDLGQLPSDVTPMAHFLREVFLLGNAVLVDAMGPAAAEEHVTKLSQFGFHDDEVVFGVPSPEAASALRNGRVSALRMAAAEGGPTVPTGAAGRDWLAAVARSHTKKNGDFALVVAPYGGKWQRFQSAADAVLGIAPPAGAQGGDAMEVDANSAVDAACALLKRCVETGIERGDVDGSFQIALEALGPDGVVMGPLTQAMARVSDDYTGGYSSLPQVLKSSRVLWKLVGRLPSEGKGASAGDKTIVIATVKGDVHDLGKTIVAILLRCNGFRVDDLGRNVELEDIADHAVKVNADMIGLSGMISPSLTRMVEAVTLFRQRGLTCPVLVGGSATSAEFCACRLDTLGYSSGVFRIPDAPKAVLAAQKLLRDGGEAAAGFAGMLQSQYVKLREERFASEARLKAELLSLEAARAKGRQQRQKRFGARSVPPLPAAGGIVAGDIREVAYTLEQVLPYVNWTFFFSVFSLTGCPPNYHTWPALLEDPDTGSEAKRLQADCDRLVGSIPRDSVVVRGAYALYEAYPVGDDDVECVRPAPSPPLRCRFLRQQLGDCQCLADFVAEASEDGRPQDHLGVFAVQSPIGEGEEPDDYKRLLMKALGDRLVEAGAELLHLQVRRLWYEEEASIADPASLLEQSYRGIRPAIGYPSAPDHRGLNDVWQLLDLERRPHLGMQLTESFALTPEASVAGLYFGHPDSKYFSVQGSIAADQVQDYAERSGQAFAVAEEWLAPSLSYTPGAPK
eukprot:TRINITY_DN30912_c0_g1_i1.p1 TRINITY_DN30912_c0_g1~~TRINITY_DN30912_c0_g1_i1.p1  ORF type:complete len:1340 (+),score=305.23 TRINITY_DN30912_c0_g1_i1:118-4137(+)